MLCNLLRDLYAYSPEGASVTGSRQLIVPLTWKVRCPHASILLIGIKDSSNRNGTAFGAGIIISS